MTKVVILGAGFGGLQAARAFKKFSDIQVTLIDRTNHHLFQPLLYQVAVAGLNPSEIASPVRSILRKQKNVISLMGEVTAIDRQARQVSIDNGAIQLDYDYLILAMGGKTSYFGNDQWESVAPGLKTLDDALNIRHRVLNAFERAEKTDDAEERRKLMTIAVIGGGPTGVEMAGALAELTRSVIRWDFRKIRPEQARIVLIEGGPRLLAAFPEKLSNYTAGRLTRMGVEVRFEERVESIEEGCVTTRKGSQEPQRLEAATVVWGAGVGGNPVARMLGCPLDRAGRVMVGVDLRLADDERVYCVGDMAHYEHPQTGGGKPLPGVAQVAMQQGQLAATNILSHLKGQPLKPFHYFDKGSMATIGRSAAVAYSAGIPMTGLLAWLSWLFIHLIYIVDFQNRILVLMRWTWSYFTWKWGARLITRVPQTPKVPPADDPVPPPSGADTPKPPS